MENPNLINAQRGLNRDSIKMLAMLTMLLNHIANVFLEPNRLLSIVLIDIGYFTAPVMCYFLAEGYQYTRSKKRYAARLTLFSVISEIPYCLAFSEMMNGVRGISFCGMNMMFTLLLCFGVLAAEESIYDLPLRRMCMAVLMFLSLFSDWALTAPILTLLFGKAGNDKRKTALAFGIGAGVFVLLNYPWQSHIGTLPERLLYGAGMAAGPLMAGVVTLRFYNGKRMEKGKAFSKWFFYLFYPVHLLILGLLRLAIC